MTPPIKSILTCLVLLTMVSDIHTQQIQELERLQEYVVSQANSNTITVLGEGIEADKVPIIIYSSTSSLLEMYAYVKMNKPCYFSFKTPITRSIVFKTIKQLTSNRLAIVWSGTESDMVTVDEEFALLDMDSCVPNLRYSCKGTFRHSCTVAPVPFVNGFELITSDNHRTAYDNNGHARSTQGYFPVKSFDFSISAVSERTHDKGYFILDYTNIAAKLIKVDGTLEKNLLNLKLARALSSNEHSMYSVCAINLNHKTIVTCYQYNQDGNRMLISSATIDFDEVLGVKNLVGGGLVFAAVKSKGKLSFVKLGMQLGQVSIWEYSGKQNFEGAKLTDYSEKDQTFTVIYKTGEEGKVTVQKFILKH